MLRFLSIICLIIVLFKENNFENVVHEELSDAVPPISQSETSTVNDENNSTENILSDTEKAIQNIETMAAHAKKLHREGIIPEEDIFHHYEDLVIAFEDLRETLKDPKKVYLFLKAKGIDRIIATNLGNDYTPLKTEAVILLKVVFEMAPTTTSSLIPIHIVDEVLNVFEKDNLALKAHALDVLYIWLPNNPKVQARVMKVKGLEPFYKQTLKLDASVVFTLLELFNKIINEHLRIHNDRSLKTEADYNKVKLYERIGLIEELSSPNTCKGLLDIFEASWRDRNEYNRIIIPVLELIKNVKQFCLNSFQGKRKAIDLFNNIMNYINENSSEDYLKENGLNVNELKLILNEYVDNLKLTLKDEF